MADARSSDRSILLTGPSGWLGRFLAPRLRAAGHAVVGLYAARGWTLPGSIGRVYDAGHAEVDLGFRCATSFADILAALREGRAMPFAHDPTYLSPKE